MAPETPPSTQSAAGALLLAERRRQGLSLGDISRQLKLSVRQVEAIERDDYSGFRGPVFVHGFIRNYAKLLNLDPGPLIRAADALLNPPAPAVVEVKEVVGSLAVGRSPRKPLVAGAFLVLIAAIVVAVLAFVGTPSAPGSKKRASVAASTQGESKLRDAAVEAKPNVAAVVESTQKEVAGAVAAEPGGQATVRMVFDQESWVEIKDRAGNTIFGQLNPAGSRRSVSGEPPLTVVVGNAAGVRLSYNDNSVDLAPHTRVDVARLTLE